MTEPHPERVPSMDDDSIDALLETQLPRLANFVRAQLGAKLRARESVSDIVQSAAREVLEDLRALPTPSRDELRAWLYRAAERKLIDRARYWNAERRDPNRETNPEGGETTEVFEDRRRPADDDRPSAPLRTAEELEQLSRALDSLTAEHREIILLARILELPHATVAQLMNRSEGATRMLLVRALTKLTEVM
ncbi:MAG: sigma-70 family RNA polymerase sigma factor [Planctomycetes bacterium]|nr:sigma-70 family RNA polymerase sigma factor [Planctomycetota bacterium]